MILLIAAILIFEFSIRLLHGSLRWLRAHARPLGAAVLGLPFVLFLAYVPRLVAWAPATYYIDVSYTGGGNNGTSTNPWTSLAAGWSTLNGPTVLGAGPVTVYSSACVATGCSSSSSGDQLDTSEMLLDRTDTSTNVLTLDGMSQYNTNTNHATAPTWSSTGNTCGPTYDARAHSQHRITSVYPINTDNSGTTTTRNYITIQGFRADATNGQIVALLGSSNTILQCNELYSTANGTGPGPGVIVQTPTFGTPTNSTNLTIQYNKIHDTYGEAIYIGASSGDPPNFGGAYTTANGLATTDSITGGATGLTVNITAIGGFLDLNNPPTVANGGTGGCYQLWDTIHIIQGGNSNAQVHVGSVSACQVTSLTYISSFQTNVNTLIQNNEIYDTATQGGQGDGTDIKDGNVNLQILNNTYYRTTAGQAVDCGSCRAIVAESWAVIDGNFIHDWVGTDTVSGIAFPDGWINSFGRSNGRLSNNILVNVGGAADRDAIEFNCGAGTTAYQLKNPVIYNNTIFSSTGNGYSFDSQQSCVLAGEGNGYQAYPSNITLENNITSTAASGAFELICNNSGTTECSWNTHSHNSWFRTASNFVIQDAGTTYGPAAANPLSSWESNSTSTDPKFTSTSSPYVATNFELGAGSPAIAAAANLSTTFTNDFCSNTRQSSPTAWDMGAWIDNPSMTTGCTPTSGPVATITTQPVDTHISGTTTMASVVWTSNTAYTGNVVVSLTSACGPTLGGTTTVTLSGTTVATFSALTLVGISSGGCSLTFTATGYTNVVSSAFWAGPNQIVWSVQPSSSYSVGATLTATIQYQFGDNTLDSASTYSTTATLGGGSCGSGSITGTTPKSAVSGSVPWSYTVGGSGSGCNIAAAGNSLTGTSGNFNILAAPAGIGGGRLIFK